MDDHDNKQQIRAADWAMSYLQALQTASESLKKALIARDPEAIFAAVDEQEDIVRRLKSEGKTKTPRPNAENSGARHREMARIIETIKKEQRTSRALAMSFLSVIDKTLQSLNAGTGEMAVTYNSSGTMGTRPASLLVHQTG